MSLFLSPADCPWLISDGAKALFALARDLGGEIRFVGGCVRDALWRRKVEDTDMASTLPPEVLAQALRKNGIKVVPIGIDHGTILAVFDGQPFEITTLRRDLETDGRHATVAFSDDWEADAARRDFTINSLYADASGRIYDYLGGAADIKARRLRFIGRAEERLAEDYLRALRYFRFMATLDIEEADDEALSACKNAAENLRQLSGERIWREMKKLLVAPASARVWDLAIRARIAPVLLPNANHVQRLSRLIKIESSFGITPLPLRRLAALGEKEAALHLPFSNKEAAIYAAHFDIWPDDALENDTAVRKEFYRRGTEASRDALLLAAAEGAKIDKAFALWRRWENPCFPLRGKDLQLIGFASGPKIGRALHEVEKWWIARDFRPNRQECLEEAKRFL
jgi:poly(A) polymerase